jgi:hypothetical protein
MYKLLNGERLPNGVIRHQIISPGDIDGERKFFDVRMALTPPAGSNKGYFLVGGEAWFDKSLYAGDRGDICIVSEYEHKTISLDGFFNKLTDAYSAYCCTAIYMDTEAHPDFLNKFYDFLDDHNIQGVNVEEAPYVDFYLGAALIMDAGKKGILNIPADFLVKSEMEKFTRKDLENNPEINFPRVNALRFLIGGFDKYPPSSISLSLPVKKVEYGKDGWLAR